MTLLKKTGKERKRRSKKMNVLVLDLVWKVTMQSVILGMCVCLQAVPHMWLLTSSPYSSAVSPFFFHLYVVLFIQHNNYVRVIML